MGRRFKRIPPKVDLDCKEIKIPLRMWKRKHQDEIYFDSTEECKAYKLLESLKVKFEFQPELTLFESLHTSTFKRDKIKPMIQRAIRFTPDFLLLNSNPKTYIEYKGYETDDFKMRWKLFKLTGHEGYIVSSLTELRFLIAELQKRNVI